MNVFRAVRRELRGDCSGTACSRVDLPCMLRAGGVALPLQSICSGAVSPWDRRVLSPKGLLRFSVRDNRSVPCCLDRGLCASASSSSVQLNAHSLPLSLTPPPLLVFCASVSRLRGVDQRRRHFSVALAATARAPLAGLLHAEQMPSSTAVALHGAQVGGLPCRPGPLRLPGRFVTLGSHYCPSSVQLGASPLGSVE